MEPTAKALELGRAVHSLLDQRHDAARATTGRSTRRPRRVPSVSVSSTPGIVRLLPPLLSHLEAQAPGRAAARNAARYRGARRRRSKRAISISRWARFATLSKRIRRQTLWSVAYVSVVGGTTRASAARPSLAAFAAERHVARLDRRTGHAHQLVERALERAIPAEHIVCRVPTFMAAAYTREPHRRRRDGSGHHRGRACDALRLRAFATPGRSCRESTWRSTGTSASIANPATAGSAQCSSRCSRMPSLSAEGSRSTAATPRSGDHFCKAPGA